MIQKHPVAKLDDDKVEGLEQNDVSRTDLRSRATQDDWNSHVLTSIVPVWYVCLYSTIYATRLYSVHFDVL